VAAPITERGIAKIRDLILAGELRPGSRLPPEHELAAQLELSRNTAREAVRALVTARVLDVRRGDGTYVTSLKPDMLLEGIGFAVDLMQDDTWLEVLEVRRYLEPAAVALAATRIDQTALRALEECLERMRGADGLEQLVVHDAEFHNRVAAAGGNQTLAAMLDGLSSKTLRARVWRGIIDGEAAEQTVAQHTDIYTALLAGDPNLAQAAAVGHVLTTETWFRRVLTSRDEATSPARRSGRRSPR
jgi:GntR family transcriptional regulator, transcriptional repressor for pyruvate dehydrogenase complex